MSEGGVPATWLHHKRYEEQPIKHVPGLREKFLSIVNRQPEGKKSFFILRVAPLARKIHETIKCCSNPDLGEIVSIYEIGDYDIKESIYAGDGYAKGIFEDPETLSYPQSGKKTQNYSVIELAGNPYPDLPIPQPDGRTLENVLIQSLSKNR